MSHILHPDCSNPSTFSIPAERCNTDILVGGSDTAHHERKCANQLNPCFMLDQVTVLGHKSSKLADKQKQKSAVVDSSCCYVDQSCTKLSLTGAPCPDATFAQAPSCLILGMTLDLNS